MNAVPYTDNLKKFIGREVTIYIYNMGKKLIEMKGICEGLDFKTKTVLIRTDTETILIPKYLYLSRKRAYIPEKR